jgi:hypothetical protein
MKNMKDVKIKGFEPFNTSSLQAFMFSRIMKHRAEPADLPSMVGEPSASQVLKDLKHEEHEEHKGSEARTFQYFISSGLHVSKILKHRLSLLIFLAS